MKATILLLAMMTLISGCSTMTPARYAVSADTNQALKKLDSDGGILTSLNSSVPYSASCRLMGPIKAGDGLTIPQFISQAINDELKFADKYNPNGVRLSGEMTKIAFSSVSGMTGGWWDLGITLRSASGGEIAVENRYEFESGFDAITACNQTAQALGAATQDLIKALVRHPGFTKLMEN